MNTPTDTALRSLNLATGTLTDAERHRAAAPLQQILAAPHPPAPRRGKPANQITASAGASS